MKKLCFSLLTLLTCGAAYALPVGNPADASLLCDGLIWEGYCGNPCDPCINWCDAFNFRLGFYGDYVYNRHMELENTWGPDVEHTEMYTNAALLVGNFWDRAEVFATLGATKFYIESNKRSFGIPGTGRFVLQTETDFSWSIGARAMIWECGCTTLGAVAQYAYAKPHIRRLTVDSTSSVYPASHVHAKYHEWQFSIGLAHRINVLVPYIAFQYSDSTIHLNDARITYFDDAGILQTLILNDLEAKNRVGYAVGVSLLDCEKMSVTVEGRFANESALHVNGQVRF